MTMATTISSAPSAGDSHRISSRGLRRETTARPLRPFRARSFRLRSTSKWEYLQTASTRTLIVTLIPIPMLCPIISIEAQSLFFWVMALVITARSIAITLNHRRHDIDIG